MLDLSGTNNSRISYFSEDSVSLSLTTLREVVKQLIDKRIIENKYYIQTEAEA
jgi:hypothetical protein